VGKLLNIMKINIISKVNLALKFGYSAGKIIVKILDEHRL
jgi:uncharacterized protein (UPF0333 family)